MNKGYVAGAVVSLMLLGGGGYYAYRHRPVPLTPEQARINLRWQEDFRPRVDEVLAAMQAQGLDVSKAKILCDRIIPSIDAGQDCIDELERIQGITPEPRQ